ncbi:unnamed protein product [Absidia cylindrospora]
MREPNLCFPSHNKAAVCITSALYDRRALDCTASLPLINSLTHLAYLTSTSPRIREILVLDGGLERLVRILAPQHLEPERRSLWKWSLAFQCVVNIGVRGTEQIRTKVVDAGMIPIVLRVLENFLRALELVRQESDRQDSNNNRTNIRSSTATSSSTSSSTPTDYTTHQELLDGILSHSRNTTEQTILDSHQLVNTTGLQPSATTFPPVMNMVNLSSSDSNNVTVNKDTSIPSTDNSNVLPGQPLSSRQQHRVLRKSTFPYIKMTAAQRRRNRLNRESVKSVPTWQDPREPNIDNVFYREEDILLSLQLLAYLSKYPHIRNQFHTNYDRNVFSVVERFCHRLHPNPIQYWAGVIMRNACRKDETKGGTRRCANMHCGKWESQPREFAKCRRCRKAKYCCKACQSKAWADGHRWWCVERHATVPQQDSVLSHPQQRLPQQQQTTTTDTPTTNPHGSTGHTTPNASAITPGHTQPQRRSTTNMTLMTGTNRSLDTVMPASHTGHTDASNENNHTTTNQAQRSQQTRRHHNFRHLLSTPTTTVPTMNQPERRPSPLVQQYSQPVDQQQQQQSPQSSATILLNDLPLHNTQDDISVVDHELGDHSQNGSTESTDHNTLLMDVGVQMEI